MWRNCEGIEDFYYGYMEGIRFINKINELYHKDISLHVIGENQTIRKLAKYIEALNEENYLTITI